MTMQSMLFGLTPTNLLAVAGLFLVALELFLGVQTGFDFVVIGTILIIGGLVGSATSSLTVGLLLSIALSVIYVVVGRNSIRQKIVVMTHKTNIDKLVGSRGIVVRSLTPDTPGLVRVGDEDWRAESDDVLFEKDKVQVVSLSGVTLKVKKLGI